MKKEKLLICDHDISYLEYLTDYLNRRKDFSFQAVPFTQKEALLEYLAKEPGRFLLLDQKIGDASEAEFRNLQVTALLEEPGDGICRYQSCPELCRQILERFRAPYYTVKEPDNGFGNGDLRGENPNRGNTGGMDFGYMHAGDRDSGGIASGNMQYGGMTSGSMQYGGKISGSMQIGSMNSGGVSGRGKGPGGTQSGGIASRGKASGGIQTGGMAAPGKASGGIQTGGMAARGKVSGGIQTGGMGAPGMDPGGMNIDGAFDRGVNSPGMKSGDMNVGGMDPGDLNYGERILGVYSPVNRCGKTIFAITLGMILAERERVLYWNLENYHGLDALHTQEGRFDMTDILYRCRMGTVSDIQELFADSVTDWGGLDCLNPAVTSYDLNDVSAGEWTALLGTAAKQCGYRTIVLDIGGQIRDPIALLSRCSRIYMPVLSDRLSQAKVKQFEENLDILHAYSIRERIRKVAVPRLRSDSELAGFPRQLIRGKIGSYARQILAEDETEDAEEA